MIPSDITFIILGLQPWSLAIGSNCKDIALEISKEHKVLYVNAPIDVNTLLKNCYKPSFIKRLIRNFTFKHRLTNPQENIWVLNPKNITLSISSLPDGRLYDLLSRINGCLFASNIKKGLKNIKSSSFILFNDSDMIKGIYLKEFLKPLLHIYYSRDNLKEVPYFRKHGKRLEQKLISKSDVCFANSTYLTDYLLEFNPNAHFIGQGCDYTKLICSDNQPKEFKKINTKVIGYIGAINNTRLDILLLEDVCTKLKAYTFMFVGPEDDVFRSSILHKLSNVVFTGPKKENQLADYIKNFDVCINPQKVNSLTIGNYPRKIDEYLFMGKPIVATNTPAMEMFNAYVYLAENSSEYIRFIEQAIVEDSDQKALERTAFARTHSWQNSVHHIYQNIELCLSQKK